MRDVLIKMEEDEKNEKKAELIEGSEEGERKEG